jgi:hypothetical protein
MSAKSLAGVAQSPTAAQVVVLEHDTPSRAASVAPPGLGLVTIAQLVPFHCSTTVLKCEFVKLQPTAKQLVVVRQETLLRTDSSVPLGFGLVRIAQLVPFHRSTSVLPVEPVTDSPTAKQLVVLGHATQLRPESA